MGGGGRVEWADRFVDIGIEKNADIMIDMIILCCGEGKDGEPWKIDRWMIYDPFLLLT